MSKKNFKDISSGADRFFSGQPHDAQPLETQTAPEPKGRKQKSDFWRVCLNLRPEFEDYVKNEAWKARKNATEYINDLILADMESKQGDSNNG